MHYWPFNVMVTYGGTWGPPHVLSCTIIHPTLVVFLCWQWVSKNYNNIETSTTQLAHSHIITTLRSQHLGLHMFHLMKNLDLHTINWKYSLNLFNVIANEELV